MIDEQKWNHITKNVFFLLFCLFFSEGGNMYWDIILQQRKVSDMFVFKRLDMTSLNSEHAGLVASHGRFES